MTVHKVLHPQADMDRLYVTHKSGSRGLLDVVAMEKHSLTLYVSKSKESIMTKIREFSLLCDMSYITLSH